MKMRTAVWAMLLVAPAMAQGNAALPAPHVAFPSDGPLGAQVQALLSAPGAARAHWGIAVTRLDGTPVFGWHEGELFRPASNNKLFTTAAAMALLGPDSRVRTVIELLRAPQGSGEKSSIVIVGDGDAYLSSPEPIGVRVDGHPLQAQAYDPLRFFNDAAKAIAALGVRAIDGGVEGSDRNWSGPAFPESWSLEDIHWGYGAPVSALSVNDNQLKLTLHPGKDIFAGGAAHNATATLLPDTGYYTLRTEVTTVSGRPADVRIEHLAPRSLRIYGCIPPGADYTTEIALDDPALFAAVTMKQALLRNGIRVGGAAEAAHGAVEINTLREDLPPSMAMHPSNATAEVQEAESRRMCLDAGGFCRIVAEHISPTLAEDAVVTLKISQNLHAEMMLRRIAQLYGTDPTTEDGVWAVRQWLRGIGVDSDDFAFYDGSGLSPKDVVTPRAVAQLLVYAAQQPWFAQWKAALPVGGVDGTLSSRYKNSALQGRIFAKTGTLGESRALSGYMVAASGETLVFSILADTHMPGSSADREAMDKVVELLAENN